MAVITLMLAGDVMTGRGIDQIMRHPSPPELHEDYVKSALDYVRLAEAANGPISRDVPSAYVWGDMPGALGPFRPDLRIVNLETAVTRSAQAWPKGINYRMHPGNIDCLTAARIDCCVLANNHVLDWREAGLIETLESLAAAGIETAGAGRNGEEAAAPAVLPIGGGGRVVIHAFACASSGVPKQWAATSKRPGVNFVDDVDSDDLERLPRSVTFDKRPGDIVICSIHWGPNWGYEIEARHRRAAHAFIEQGADIVHGHSSHHPKAIEMYQGRPILYGCGDFLNDYEGIGPRDQYRSDLALAYLPALDLETGRLKTLDMVPLRIRKFRLDRAPADDTRFLAQDFDRECRRFGLSVRAGSDGTLSVR